MKTKGGLRLSLPREKSVHGYTITRAPLGRFLDALAALGDFPDTLAEGLLGGGDMRELLTTLKSCDAKLLWRLAGRALKIAPAETVRLIATLTQIDEERLLNDERLGLEGLCEIVLAWAELNDIEGFFQQASGIVRLWRTLATRRDGRSG